VFIDLHLKRADWHNARYPTENSLLDFSLTPFFEVTFYLQS